MSLKVLASVASVLLLAFAPAIAQAPPSAEIKTADGKTIGMATFREGTTGVLVQVKVEGLSPGWHGMHFHTVGDCSDPKFLKSGAHMNMAEMKKPHGLLNPMGPDFGDLPNIYVGKDGAAEMQAFSSLVSWSGAGGRPALTDADGSALVIHAMADDHMTQPIGGAGDRVACAVIK